MIHAYDTGDTLSITFCFDCNHSGNASLLLHRFFGSESCSGADCLAYDNAYSHPYADAGCFADQHRFFNAVPHPYPYAGTPYRNDHRDADGNAGAHKYLHANLDGDLSSNCDPHSNCNFNGIEYTFTNSYFYSAASCIHDAHFYVYGTDGYRYDPSSERYTLSHD